MNRKLTKEMQQLSRLLLSAEVINLSMALEIIDTIQATPLFEVELFLAYQYTGNKKNKDTILHLIKQAGNTKLLAVFNKSYSFKTATNKKIKEYIDTIPKAAGFNKTEFALTLFKITKEKAMDYVLEHGTKDQRIEVLNILKTKGSLTIKSDTMSKLPKEIKRFTDLKHLKIQCIKLKKFPMVLTSMQHLESLNLSGTRLTKIPKDIGKLKNLKKLTIPTQKDNTSKLKSKLAFLKQLNINIRLDEPEKYIKAAKKLLPNCDICVKH